MKKNILIILTLLLQLALHAQKKGQARIDSLVEVLNKTRQDTTRVNTLNTLASDLLQNGKTDSAIELSSSALLLAKKINFTFGEADAYYLIGQAYAAKANKTEALKNYENALRLYEQTGHPA